MGPEVIKLHDVHLVVGRRNSFSGEILLVATGERADFPEGYEVAEKAPLLVPQELPSAVNGRFARMLSLPDGQRSSRQGMSTTDSQFSLTASLLSLTL